MEEAAQGRWPTRFRARAQREVERVVLVTAWSLRSFRYKGAGDDPEAKRKVGELHLQRRKTRPLEQKRKVEGR